MVQLALIGQNSPKGQLFCAAGVSRYSNSTVTHTNEPTAIAAETLALEHKLTG